MQKITKKKRSTNQGNILAVKTFLQATKSRTILNMSIRQAEPG